MNNAEQMEQPRQRTQMETGIGKEFYILKRRWLWIFLIVFMRLYPLGVAAFGAFGFPEYAS